MLKIPEAKFKDNLREAGPEAERWYEYEGEAEGEDDHPFPKTALNNYGIMLVLGGCAAVVAMYAM